MQINTIKPTELMGKNGVGAHHSKTSAVTQKQKQKSVSLVLHVKWLEMNTAIKYLAKDLMFACCKYCSF